MVSNKWHNLQNKIVQFTGQKKACIGTIAILKGLKCRLSFSTSLKSKTQLIQLTRQTGTLKCWNVGIELSICDTTKSPPIYTLPQFLSMSENNCGIYWLDSFNSLTSHNSLKSSKQFTVSVSCFLLGDNFHSQILKKAGGLRKKMSAWGDLKSSCHGYLPGGLTMFLAKNRLLKIKYGFVSSISNVGLGLGDN